MRHVIALNIQILYKVVLARVDLTTRKHHERPCREGWVHEEEQHQRRDDGVLCHNGLQLVRTTALRSSNVQPENVHAEPEQGDEGNTQERSEKVPATQQCNTSTPMWPRSK